MTCCLQETHLKSEANIGLGCKDEKTFYHLHQIKPN
jgi:hypothetical protein